MERKQEFELMEFLKQLWFVYGPDQSKKLKKKINKNVYENIE